MAPRRTFRRKTKSSLTMMSAAPPPQTFPYDHLFKILVIGDAGVGKVSIVSFFESLNEMAFLVLIHALFVCSSPAHSLFYTQSSMLLRFTDDSFDEHIQSTIGVDFKVKHLRYCRQARQTYHLGHCWSRTISHSDKQLLSRRTWSRVCVRCHSHGYI